MLFALSCGAVAVDGGGVTPRFACGLCCVRLLLQFRPLHSFSRFSVLLLVGLPAKAYDLIGVEAVLIIRFVASFCKNALFCCTKLQISSNEMHVLLGLV